MRARTPRQAYDALIAHSKETCLLRSTLDLLAWDQRINLPTEGASYRSDQVEYLSGLIHDRATAPQLGEWLDIVEHGNLTKDADGDETVNVREIRRAYDRLVKIPAKLVKELSQAQSAGMSLWQEARSKADFGMFEPLLTRLVSLTREVAEAIGYPEEAYDALLDEYEPGLTAKDAAVVLAELKKELVPFLGSIAQSGRKPNTTFLQAEYPVNRQELFCRSAAAAIGFRFSAGRIDVTTHPFSTTLGPSDCRLSTRYHPNKFPEAFFAVLHEAGHGLYYQGLDPNHFGTPRGSDVSHGVNESQSRIWETSVGHSRAFWVHFFPRAQQMFPEHLWNVRFEDFFFAINSVTKQFIRVGSDEVTYNLHIILRFEIERALFAGKIRASDIPSAWRDGFKTLFDLVPTNDREGCLQDVHWGRGAFGYFPAYTLGNIYAAQIYAQAKNELPDLENGFERGEFESFREWLRLKVHSLGQRYRAKPLIERITGEPPSSRALMAQLRERYGQMYGVCPGHPNLGTHSSGPMASVVGAQNGEDNGENLDAIGL